ncbi:acetylornithine deacetylase [Paracoccus seriniphilus]|uniref:acetylornithine deacetylase n=1 Tax=Paracoccus seriniphilus TaxID=184748 RepID=UPI003564F1B5
MMMTEILAELVSVPSLPGTPNDRITDVICGRLDAPGVTLHRLATPEGRWNLLASIGPADLPGLMLSGHSDVVSTEGQEWDSDPFCLTEVEDRLVARGTSDMKGFLAAMLDLVPDLLQMPLKRPVHLAFSCDEEIGCRGVPHLIARLPELIARPAGCVVGEPSDLHPVRAHKGKQSVEIRLEGRPGHSSDPAQGVNAIYPAARLALEVENIAAAFAAMGPFDQDFTPPNSTLQAGVIQGGVAVNIIPEHARMLIEARTIPAQSPADVIARVSAALDHIGASAKAAGRPFRSTIEVLASYPALSPRGNEELAGLLSQITGQPIIQAVSYGTEAGLFAQAGIPSVVCGPGNISRAHRANEFIHPQELSACADMLRKIVSRNCL